MANINKTNLINLFKRVNFPMSANQVLKELKLPRESKGELKQSLKKLVSEGKVKKVRGGKFKSSSSSPVKNKNHQKKNVEIDPNTKILGDIFKRHDNFFVAPRNETIPELIVDGQANTKFQDGDLVIARLLENKKNGYMSCVVTRAVGKAGEIEVEKKGLLLHHGLKKSFPKSVKEQTRKIPDEIKADEIDNRVDLTGEIIFTIDGEDAKDYDDAVGIRKTKSGYKLWVSIADVSHYVKPGSPLDREAGKRATSTYLSDSVVPMLPEKLSNNLCSLVPNQQRLTKTAEINFDKNGNIKDYNLYNSRIKSAARLTYTWVEEVLQDKVKPDKDNKKIVSKIKLMNELYKKLKKKRVEMGELEFYFPEPKIIRDRYGRVKDIQKSAVNTANGIIEEFMIAANSIVAGHIFKNDVPSLYRIHEKPDELAIMELKKELNDIGLDVKVSGDITPKEIQKVLWQAKDRNDSNTISMMVLRSLNKAIYSTKHIPHFGLAIDDYTHFTSPIRRYPDLIVHRVLDSLISNEDQHYKIHVLDRIAEKCSVREREAEKVERESINLESAFFMKDHLDSTFEATVISIHPFGVFVELVDYFVEGLIPKGTYRGKGKKKVWFEIGDKVNVKLVEADVKKRRLTFNVV